MVLGQLYFSEAVTETEKSTRLAHMMIVVQMLTNGTIRRMWDLPAVLEQRFLEEVRKKDPRFPSNSAYTSIMKNSSRFERLRRDGKRLLH